jgi:phosphoribosylformimino-5-aminoimidazole carboxamide ribotide isomerase
MISPPEDLSAAGDCKKAGLWVKILIMLIIPAVDIRGGMCVRLRQGRLDAETVFGDDPAAMGLKWQDAGAEWLHVVDLDGAFSGSPRNLDAIRRLRRALAIPLELGGGLRNLETIRTYAELGIDRLILGTVVLKDPDLAARACAEFPGRIAFGLDAKDGLLAVEGWTETSRRTAQEVVLELSSLQPAAFIYTDIARDGVKTGVNLEATRALAEAVDIPVIASGGVSSLEDIKALLSLEKAGVVGVIVGRALYDGNLDLAEAIRLAQKPKTKT